VVVVVVVVVGVVVVMTGAGLSGVVPAHKISTTECVYSTHHLWFSQRQCGH